MNASSVKNPTKPINARKQSWQLDIQKSKQKQKADVWNNRGILPL